MANNTDGVKAVRTCLQIVKLLHDQNGSTPTEIAERIDISPSTAHRHLSTLYDCGYLQREGKNYFVGYRFLNLGESLRYRKRAYRSIANKLTELTEETGLETDFSVIDHGRLIVLHQVHQDEKYWDSRSVGNYYYMHSTSAGKAMLAEFTDERVAEIISQWGLTKQTENTITSRDELAQELERTQQRGYGLNDEESTKGLRSVGHAIQGPNGDLLGAISISGPTYRVSETDFRGTLPELMERATDELATEIQ